MPPVEPNTHLTRAQAENRHAVVSWSIGNCGVQACQQRQSWSMRRGTAGSLLHAPALYAIELRNGSDPGC